MSEIDTRLAYIPRDEGCVALARRVIELTVARWPQPAPDVDMTAQVREYLGDGLFALEVTRTDNSKFDLMTLVTNDEWQTVETGAAWVQVDEAGALLVAYEMDHDPLPGAQLAEYPPVITPHPFAPHIPADTEAELVGVADLAAEYGIPYQTAVGARRRGKLAARRVGRDYATTRAAFRRWLESRP